MYVAPVVAGSGGAQLNYLTCCVYFNLQHAIII